MMTEKKISVVIPMYNEEENAEPLVEEVAKALTEFDDYEIIVVDDGSKDRTYEILQSLKARFPKLNPLRHIKNSGQSASTVTGVLHAKFAWVATLDGDGQNDPADIPALLQAVQRSYQSNQPTMAIGYRNKRNDDGIRKLSSRVANGIRGWLLKDDCPDSGCGLKVFPRELFLRLPHFNHLHRFMPALFKRHGATILNIPVNHRPRMRGVSKYGVWNRLWVGIVDLFGVVWLIRRPCHAEVERSDS